MSKTIQVQFYQAAFSKKQGKHGFGAHHGGLMGKWNFFDALFVDYHRKDCKVICT